MPGSPPDRPAEQHPLEPGAVLPRPPTIGRVSRAWRRQIADAEWPRPGYAADGGRIGAFEVLAASVVGHGHLHRAIQRQDAYRLAAAAGEGAVLAIADGVSEMPMAAIGAEVAAFVAVQCFLASAAGVGGPGSSAPPVGERLAGAVDEADEAVREVAAELGLAPRELSTTLLIAHLARGAQGQIEVETASVGNSSALEVAGDDPPLVISGPRPGDPPALHGQFLPGSPGSARTSRAALRPGAVLALVTDGLADDLHESATVRRWLWGRLAAAESPLEFAHALSYRRQGSMDDLTVVAARAVPAP